MNNHLKRYLLSQEADFDIDAIFDYTEQEHSFNQAIKYLLNLESVFENLVINPEIGRERNEIKKGLFSITEQEHIIFYRILKNNIRIVKVIHGSKDIPKEF
jgi:toxin ParE1/3/4